VNAAPQMPHYPVCLLRDRLNMDMLGIRGTRTNRPDLLIRVRACRVRWNGRR
jgi:hypothetical protein